MTNNRVPILIENLSHSLDYLNKIKEYYDLNDLEHDSKELLSISLKKYQEMCKKTQKCGSFAQRAPVSQIFSGKSAAPELGALRKRSKFQKFTQ